MPVQGANLGTSYIISCLHCCHANNYLILQQSVSLKVALSTGWVFLLVTMEITEPEGFSHVCENLDFYSASPCNYPGSIISFYTALLKRPYL